MVVNSSVSLILMANKVVFFMGLSPEQKQHVVHQLKQHDREGGVRRIVLVPPDGKSLEFYVSRGVFGSDIMSSGIYMSRYLYKNTSLYFGKHALDMGCGPGTLGLVMALQGATWVTLADINPKAIEDTRRNLNQFGFVNAAAFESDLFAGLPEGRFDVIVFNHPFFPAEAEPLEGINDVALARSMMGGTSLIKRFFKQAQSRLSDNGLLIMPYYHFAGPENDPTQHAKSFGFRILRCEEFVSEEGLQPGGFSISIFCTERDFSSG